MIKTSKEIIKNISINSINTNIRKELINKYDINDLIIINYNGNKISDINYNLNNTYNMLIELKGLVVKTLKEYNFNNYSYDIYVYDNYLILGMPFYSFTDNLLLANLGPRIKAKVNYVNYVSGSVKTKVSSYGINSLLLELYLVIDINTTVVVPFKNEDSTYTSEILLNAKVIQGEIPSLYNGVYEKISESIKS